MTQSEQIDLLKEKNKKGKCTIKQSISRLLIPIVNLEEELRKTRLNKKSSNSSKTPIVVAIFVSCSDKSTTTNPVGNTDAADQAAYDAANGVNGAQMYDQALNYIKANQTNYPDKFTNFFRCKSCHGWDLLGQKGVLIGKKASSTYPTAVDVNLYTWSHSHSIREVFDAVKNTGGRVYSDAYDSKMPDYGKILTDAQIWDLVKFLKETAHNVSDFYDMTTTGTYPNGTKTFSNIGKGGDPVAGLSTYNAICKSCHGADGTAINIYCKNEFLGGMFRNDPHEIQHKTIWGMPIDREHIDAGCQYAGAMPATGITDQDIRNLMVMGQDSVKFPGE